MLRWKMCLPGERWACPTGLSPVKSLRRSASFQLCGLIKQEECVLHESYSWLCSSSMSRWYSTRMRFQQRVDVRDRAGLMRFQSRAVMWFQSRADQMRFQSRADVLPESRADSSAELLWSQSSTGSEEVPVGNHDDCFSEKQVTNFSIYIFRWQWSSLTRSEDRWSRGSHKKPETRSHSGCQMMKTTFLAKRECWFL